MTMQRRDFLKAAGIVSAASVTASLTGCASAPVPRKQAAGHVVVVGGGYGGATVAKYLRKWSEGGVRVTLVERNPTFISCPISNLILSGDKTLDDITVSYDGLKNRWGVKVIQDEAVAVDPVKRTLRLAQGGSLSYDRLVLSPGVDFLWSLVPALDAKESQEKILHAWKAGPQTVLLRAQIEALPDGGVFAMHIPRAPYRCPPGPYERACLVAHYLKQHKPRAKVLVLDANSEIQSKKALFQHAFDTTYRGIVEYRPDSALLAVDAGRRTLELEFDRVRADVLNVIPPMRAGRLADRLGVPLINGHWVGVDWRTMEALDAPGVHVIGDATQAASGMPKSGHMANQHAKHAAAAIVALLEDRPAAGDTPLVNTCFSFLDDRQAAHVASVHRYDPQQATMLPVSGAGGLSAAPSAREGDYARDWARAIWADMLG